MSLATLKQKSKPIDFKKEYNKIVRKSNEFIEKNNYSSFHVNTGENFKKFSLYKDSPKSITSFNTNATL